LITKKESEVGGDTTGRDRGPLHAIALGKKPPGYLGKTVGELSGSLQEKQSRIGEKKWVQR